MTNTLELFDSIDILSSVAVYVQIENIVRFAIASGKLNPDDQLPSAMSLAEHLDVNFNTVGKGYRDLEVMGLVYTRRGRGVFIEKDAKKNCQERIRTEIISRLHEVSCEAKAAGMTLTDVRAIVRASLASDAKPYSPIPDEVLSAAKKKK